MATIGFETKLPVENLSKLLDSLKPKVEWYPEDNLMWVKNFLRRQAKSPKFLVAAANCLKAIHNNGLIKNFLEYNYTLSIPYQYSSSSIPIPPSASASANASANKEGRGEEEELAKISKLYEENIGMLTPTVAESVKDIAHQYPSGWFEEALKEAVKSEHRNLKYIEAILERWKVEGFKSQKRGGKGKKGLSTTKELKKRWKPN